MGIEFLTWSDGIEIIFFSTGIYYFSLWLKQDHHKNLLGYFYSYCTLALIAYHVPLYGISFLLCMSSPIVFMLFILVHQNTLQKNFVALRNIVPAHKESADWLDIFIRACLINSNNNKELLCVIEHHDNLHELLSTPLNLQAPLKEDLLTIILESPSFNNQQLLWINSQGKLLGINAQWINHTHAEFLGREDSWKDNALLFTTKIDALVVHISPATHTFDIVVKGKLFNDIRTNKVIPFIKKYLATPPTHGEMYAHQSSSSHHPQQRA